MPQLIISEPDRSPVAIDLHEPLVAGRDKQNPLPLVHQPISRQHAVFERDGDDWIIRDLDSANGTFVNGIRATKKKLAEGDVIQIGPVRLVFIDESPPNIVIRQSAATDLTLKLPPSNERLALLYEVARAAEVFDDVEALLGHLPETVLKVVGCERAMVALSDRAGQAIVRQIARGRAHDSAANELVVSRSIVHAVLGRRESMVISTGQDAPKTAAKQGILSAMAVPLETAGHVFGFLYVDDRRREYSFGAEDLDFLRILGRLLATLLDNAERLDRTCALQETGWGRTDIVGQSAAMQRLRHQIDKVAAAPTAHVLILGESGTGKDLVARALHKASARARQPFVTVHCAAIPDTMIESFLFGYAKGAYSGIAEGRRGQFVLADGGTLLLDEIGDLSLSAQAKVLRVLQSGDLLPLGAEHPLRVDVRVVATTHKDLRQQIAEGRFREDLYYRLNVLEIQVPPLREREGDIELLSQTFVETTAFHMGKRVRSLSPSALLAIRSYPWPGNVRELKNEVERAVVEAEGSAVEIDDLSFNLRQTILKIPAGLQDRSLAQRYAALETTEQGLVDEALRTARGNLTEAARLLGITRIMMRRRVERFGMKCKDA